MWFLRVSVIIIVHQILLDPYTYSCVVSSSLMAKNPRSAMLCNDQFKAIV